MKYVKINALGSGPDAWGSLGTIKVNDEKISIRQLRGRRKYASISFSPNPGEKVVKNLLVKAGYKGKIYKIVNSKAYRLFPYVRFVVKNSKLKIKE